MLKHFYLLLLLSFQLSFCYEFNFGKEEKFRPKQRRVNKKRYNSKLYENHNEKLFENPRQSNEALEENEEPLAQIDVARFIEPPEVAGLNKDNFFKDKRSKQTKGYVKSNPYPRWKTQKNYNDINARSDVDSFDEQNTYNERDFDPNALLADETKQVLRQDALMTGKRNVQIMADDNSDGVEKRALSLFKFPFFSRNKSETMKPKLKKKRRLFHFETRPDKLDELPEKQTTLLNHNNKVDVATESTYKVNKRSYKEGILCPMCKKLYFSDAEEEEGNNRNKRGQDDPEEIHNSRQYFNQLLKVDDGKVTESSEMATEVDDDDDDDEDDESIAENDVKETAGEAINDVSYDFAEAEDLEGDRDKRSFDQADDEEEKRMHEAETQRRLAEIDIVEKKIDAAKMNPDGTITNSIKKTPVMDYNIMD